jgi:hypothetical protein
VKYASYPCPVLELNSDSFFLLLKYARMDWACKICFHCSICHCWFLVPGSMAWAGGFTVRKIRHII